MYSILQQCADGGAATGGADGDSDCDGEERLDYDQFCQVQDSCERSYKWRHRLHLHVYPRPKSRACAYGDTHKACAAERQHTIPGVRAGRVLDAGARPAPSLWACRRRPRAGRPWGRAWTATSGRLCSCALRATRAAPSRCCPSSTTSCAATRCCRRRAPPAQPLRANSM